MRAIQLTFIPTLGVNILMIIHQASPWKALRPYIAILPAMIFGTMLGSLLLIYLNPKIFRVLLALVIMAFLWLDTRGYLRRTNPDENARGILLAGLVTGILVGNINAGVPVLIIFSLYNKLSRRESMVLFNSCFLAGKLTQLALFGSLGVLNWQWQKLGLVLLLVAISGVILGQWLGNHLDQARWRIAMRWVLFLIALSLIYQVGRPYITSAL